MQGFSAKAGAFTNDVCIMTAYCSFVTRRAFIGDTRFPIRLLYYILSALKLTARVGRHFMSRRPSCKHLMPFKEMLMSTQ